MATGSDKTNPGAEESTLESMGGGDEDTTMLMRELLTALEGQGKAGTSNSGKHSKRPLYPVRCETTYPGSSMSSVQH